MSASNSEPPTKQEPANQPTSTPSSNPSQSPAIPQMSPSAGPIPVVQPAESPKPVPDTSVSPKPKDSSDVWEKLDLLMAIGLVGTLCLIGTAVWKKEIGAIQGALWVIGATGFTIALVALVTLCRKMGQELLAAIDKDGPPRFERHWGGLGGSVGGWAVSKSMIYFVALALSLLAMVATLNEIRALSSYLLPMPTSPSVTKSADGVKLDVKLPSASTNTEPQKTEAPGKLHNSLTNAVETGKKQ